MNQSYWAIINHFDIALINNELPFGTAEEIGTSGRKSVKIGEHKGFPLNLVPATEADLSRWAFVFLRTQIARSLEEVLTMHRAVALNHFLETHQFLWKMRYKKRAVRERNCK